MRLIALFTFISLGFSGFSQAEFNVENKVVKFDKTVEGEVLECDFKITNKGNQPLVISKFEVQCTCTKVIIPKKPLVPDSTGTVHVSFDTNEKIGWQYRKIRLFSNDPDSPHEVEMRVKVIPKE